MRRNFTIAIKIMSQNDNIKRVLRLTLFNTENTCFITEAIVLQLRLFTINLVEAGGIEPPSEKCQAKVSTCLFSVLNLAQAISQRQDSTQASSSKSRPIHPELMNQTSPLK
jgi:hypothetical protein